MDRIRCLPWVRRCLSSVQTGQAGFQMALAKAEERVLVSRGESSGSWFDSDAKCTPLHLPRNLIKTRLCSNTNDRGQPAVATLVSGCVTRCSLW